MPRLTPVHWKRLEKVFLELGFVFERESSSHRTYAKEGVDRPVVIPKYYSIGPDIILANLRTAGVSRDVYLRILAKY